MSNTKSTCLMILGYCDKITMENHSNFLMISSIGGIVMRRKILILIAFLIVLISLVGISYASWLYKESQNDFNTLGSKCFEITMTKETEAIIFFKAYPITDEEGLKQTGYTFSIKNTCDTYASYDVRLENMEVEGKRLDKEYVKVSLNDSTPEVLSFYEENLPTIEGADASFKLTSGSLAPEEEVSYTLKLWMDEDTPAIEETMNALFESKISIEAGYIKEEQRENTISLEGKSTTIEMNKDGEVFEFKGVSEKYNIIEYSTDKIHWTSIERPSKEVSITQKYEANGSQKFYFKDEMGNIEELEVEVTKVDKEKPLIEISAIEGQEKVELTIQFKENYSLSGYQITTTNEEPTEWIDIEGTTKEITYTITENKTYYIWVKDEVGNISMEEYIPGIIDNQAPSLEIENVLSTWGSKDQIQIKASDDVTGIRGISISEEEGTYNWEEIESGLEYETTREITKNGTYYISVKDGYNHITTKSIVIDKIDDIKPNIESLTSDSTWGTINHITGIIKDNESGLSGYQITTTNEEPAEYISISGNSYTLNYEVTTNGRYYIWVKDVIGNVYSTSIEVNKIDDEGPVLSNLQNPTNGNWTNQDFAITFSIKEEGSGFDYCEYSYDNQSFTRSIGTLTNGNFTTENLTIQGEKTVYWRCYDKSGNQSNTLNTAVKIDKSAPNIQSISTYYQILGNVDYVIYGYESDAGADGEWITNSGDPQLDFLDVSRYKNIKGVYLELASSLSADLAIQIFYSTGPSYTETNSVKTTLLAGSKALYIPLPQNNYTKIRLDIGDRSGLKYQFTYLALDAENNTYTNGNVLLQLKTNEIESGIKKYYYSYDQQTWYEDFEFAIEEANIKKRFVAERNQQVYFKAVDNAGNTSNIISTWVKIDKTGPNIQDISTYYQILGNSSYTSNGYVSDAGPTGEWTTNSGDPKINFTDVSHYKNIKGVYIELVNPLTENITIQVFYATSGNYTEANSTRITLNARAKSIYISIPQNNYTQIRFDIGEKSGLKYKINYLALDAEKNSYTNGNVILQIKTTENQSGIKKYNYSYDQKTWYEDFEYALEGANVKKQFSVERNQQVYFRAIDNAGNISNIPSTWVKIDRTKPTVGITATGQGANITVTATNAADNISGISTYYYKLDNGQWYRSSSSSYTFTNVLAGTHTVYVKVKDTAGNESNAASTTAKSSYKYQFTNLPGKNLGNQTTYQATGSSITLHSHNSTSTGASVGVQLALSNMSLVNPTVSFDYKFTTSRSMNGAFLFYSNLSIALEDYPLYITSSKTGTFNQQLSGTISYLYFGIDSYNTYTSDVSITNLKINGETINFESLTKIE